MYSIRAFGRALRECTRESALFFCAWEAVFRGWRKSAPTESLKCMAEAQIKSKERVAERGEVFTAEREVKAMCDLVKDETERIDSRFLEPACGDGNFLAEILRRKLGVVTRKYRKSAYDWERNSLLALGSMYGVDIQADNCEQCRERLFGIWDAEYRAVCKKELSDDTKVSAKFILSRNIVCGNALTLHCVDEKGGDTACPIVFSEWTIPFNDARMQRKDYTMAELLEASEVTETIERTGQLDLFANDKGEVEPTFLKQYIAHYRRISEGGECHE